MTQLSHAYPTCPMNSELCDGLYVDALRLAGKNWRGRILLALGPDRDIALGAEPMYECGHHHHSRGSAKDCAKNTRGWLRRILKGNAATIAALNEV